MQDALYHIQTDAAAGDFGNLIGGAEAGAEDKIKNIRLAQTAGFLGLEQTSFDGAGLDSFRIDAAAVVADFHDDLIALVIGFQADRSSGRLAGSSTLLFAFNAVAD